MRTLNDLNKNSNLDIRKIYIDDLSRMYNNLWGSLSDTNMRKINDTEWIITGNRVGCKEYFNALINSEQPIYPMGNIRVENTFSDILFSNNLKGDYIEYNNQIAYKIHKIN